MRFLALHRPHRRLIALSLLAMALLVLAAACSSDEPTPTAPPTPTALATPTPTALATPTPTATQEPTPTSLPNALFLSVSTPEDESFISDVVITVRGETTPDAVISINGEPVDVDVLGQFSVVVDLIEGPNLIEVVASNLTDQRQVEIAVISLP